jgi:transmembrane sensor
MKKLNFHTLIDKYLNDELSIEQNLLFEAWLKHIGGDENVDQVSILEQNSREQRILKAINEKVILKTISKSNYQKLQPLYKIAASVLFVFSLLALFIYEATPIFNVYKYASIVNSNNMIKKAILSDGSIVWLKGKSKLTYPLKFSNDARKVELEGEALFEVAKDPEHPFFVKCGDLTTRVLGTSFNIKHVNNTTEVNVLTGRVFLSLVKSKAILLLPFQKAIYSPLKNTITKESRPVSDVSSLTTGTEYNMLFNDAKVAEVVSRIEGKFEVTIVSDDLQLYKNKITADFTDLSIQNTVKILCETFNLKYKMEGNVITLEDKV